MLDTPAVRILPGNIQNINETGLYLVGMISALDVKALYESNVNTNVYTDADKFAVSNIRCLAPITVTENYQVLIDDLARQSIRIDSDTPKTLTMPAMTESYDGALLSFIILGVGDVKLLGNYGQTMVNGAYLSIVGTQKYSMITLEYVHPIITWVVSKSTGNWAGETS